MFWIFEGGVADGDGEELGASVSSVAVGHSDGRSSTYVPDVSRRGVMIVSE